MRRTARSALFLTCLLGLLIPATVLPGQCNLGAWATIVATPNMGFGDFGPIEALEVFDNGNGPVLYAGGDFSSIGGVPAVDIARWDGTTWSALGSGIGGGPWTYVGVLAIEHFDDGTGPAIYVGGLFSTAGGTPAMSVARWDGSTWSPVGSGLVDPFMASLPGRVHDLHVWDDGSGPALYAAGRFAVPGSPGGYSIARWDGSSWSLVGGGFNLFNPLVSTTVSFDDGTGPALYLAIEFLNGSTLGGVAVGHVARWDGANWQSLGTPPSASQPENAMSLVSFAGVTGPALYVGGDFTSMYGVTAQSIAKYQNGVWSAIPGLNSPGPGSIESMQVFDDGSGPALYVGGYNLPNGMLDFGKWDGMSWTAPVPGGIGTQHLREMAVMQVGGSPTLLLDVTSISNLQAWTGCNNSITSQMIQAGGPGAPVYVTNTNLHRGAEIYNIFSVEACAGGVGTGPYLGLCASPGPNLQFLISQALLPLGVAPFHVTAADSHVYWGPFYLPPGATLDTVCFDFTGGVFGAVSPVSRLVVQ